MALTGSYLDRDEFAARSMAPESIVLGDFIDPTGEWSDSALIAKRERWRTFVAGRLVSTSSRINARLRKRYAVPFASPVPEVVLGWLADIVTPIVYRKRGIDPADEQIVSADAAAAAAEKELTEAADSEIGLFDLPLIQSTSQSTESGITQGGPFGYSEASPYDWMDRQREALS